MTDLPELLAPAGGMAQLRAALRFGADAVYGGMKRFGLRAFAGNFDEDMLQEAVRLCHGAGKKFYLTMNVFPYDDQLDAFLDAAKTAKEIGVDAVIVGDLGAICLLREKLPELAVHVSTQASVTNTAAVQHYGAMGCERVILAREVSIARLAAMHEALGDTMELETFVHGASCMAWSGRCMLSAALTGRSANQGACAQPCRWQYDVVERKRAGEYMPVCEDGNGTYLFSARDLNLMVQLPALVQAGAASLKIEGRMKTEYYVATVVAAYRRGLDALAVGQEAFEAALPDLLQELSCASHRLSDTGFALGAPQQPGGAEGFHQEAEFIARVMKTRDASGCAEIEMKNRFHAGDVLSVLTPAGVKTMTAPSFVRLSTGETLDTLGIAGERLSLAFPFDVAEGDLIRGEVRNHRK